MIKVLIAYKGKGLERITVSGHASSAPYPHDLVCAMVTGISIGILNALEGGEETYDIEVDEGLVDIAVKGPISEHDMTVLETYIIQLKTIEQSPKTKGTIVIKERK